MQISASQLPLVHAVGASGARRARAAAAAAPLGLKPLQLSSRTAQTARGASAISLEGRVRRSSKATAASRVVTTSSLEGVFKQSKESLQWVTIFLTFGSIVAVAAPMAVMGKASLLTVSTIALGGAGLWLFVEVVGDWIRGQHLIKTGRKEEWMDKSRTIAREARARSEAGPTMQAKNWLERNVSGAATEEDAKIIRNMNEFLGVEADS